MDIDVSQFLNPYDISFIIICLISIFYGIKNGLIKSIFNLLKWIIILFLIKNCFSLLRPLIDPYILNHTISNILIFLFTFITSYIFISFVNRIIIGVLQPKKSGFIDFSFGAVLGIFRGYLVFVLIIFFINNNVSTRIFPDFMKSGSFKGLVNYGENLLDDIPQELNQLNNIGN